MRVRRTPFLNLDKKPIGVARKHFSSPPLASMKSLEFNGGCTVLSISASNSILSEKALQAFKYAFLRNQKIGIGSLPSNEEPSKLELDKANAAYQIARELVDWSEQICVDDYVSLDLDNEDNEHRSCDLKKEDSLVSRFADAKDLSPRDAKDLSPREGEGKDFDLDFTTVFGQSIPDLKLTGPLLEPFLDDVLLTPFTPCEGMDFFGSPSLDDLCETQKWNGKLARVDRVAVDISFGAIEDTMPLMLNDGDNEDNLVSPLSSPGSPCSPASPY